MCSVSLGRWRKCSVGLEKGREINCLIGSLAEVALCVCSVGVEEWSWNEVFDRSLVGWGGVQYVFRKGRRNKCLIRLGK